MKHHIFFVVGQLLCLLIASCSISDNRLSSLEEKNGWILLFDGKTMNGWRGYQGKEVLGYWKIENGSITGLGHGSDSTGYLISDDLYQNFALTFDWKISVGGTNSVFYHFIERPLFKVLSDSGSEYRIIDSLGYDWKMKPWEQVGVDYVMYPPADGKDVVKKTGEWNSSKIVFDDGHVEHWLNGKKIVDFKDLTLDWYEKKEEGKDSYKTEYGLARFGHITLQDKGSRVWYKNIKLKELPSKSKNEVLFNGADLTGWIVYGKELWYVDRGELVCESGPAKGYGYLATKKYYKDFDLTLDFKQVEDGNSGVFIRSIISEGANIAAPGWQVEVAPQGLNTGGIYESGGRKWLIKPSAENEKALKMGRWNQMRILVKGNQVTTWLNGVRMVQLDDEKFGQGQGRIMLQIHKGGGIKVRWKNLVLKEL